MLEFILFTNMAGRQLWMLVFVAALCAEAVSSHALIPNGATYALQQTFAAGARSDVLNADVSEILSAADGPRIACGQQGVQQTARHLAQASPQNEGPVGIAAAPKAADHKPLFPVSGLEVAVLVIAGVVLFIAAGKRDNRHAMLLCVLMFLITCGHHQFIASGADGESCSCESWEAQGIYLWLIAAWQQPRVAKEGVYRGAVMQVLAWEEALCWSHYTLWRDSTTQQLWHCQTGMR